MPRRSRIDWQAIDWSLDNRTIADQTGMTYYTVETKRSRLGVGPSARKAERRDKGKVKPNQPAPSWEHIERMLEKKRGSARCQRGEQNHRAKHWTLISPDNCIYRIRNLYQFVRDHPHLFAPRDVIWKRSKGKGTEYCNATAGLLNVSSGKSSNWKDWRVEKKTE